MKVQSYGLGVVLLCVFWPAPTTAVGSRLTDLLPTSVKAFLGAKFGMGTRGRITNRMDENAAILTRGGGRTDVKGGRETGPQPSGDQNWGPEGRMIDLSVGRPLSALEELPFRILERIFPPRTVVVQTTPRPPTGCTG